jgi:protein gp37
MAENSAISWTNHTFNPWVGCTKVSPACDGCYAEAQMAGRFGRVEWGGPGKGDGTRDRTSPQTWRAPRKWDREAAAELARTPGALPTFVFCASLADVFDNAVPPAWRRDLFELIRATPNLTWLLLTKRPGNIVKLFADTLPATADKRDAALERVWPRNAAIGCTVVTQEEADRDIPKLLAAKAALNPAFAFLSMEPLLGPVDISPWLDPDGACEGCDAPGCERLDIPRDQQSPKSRAIYDHPEGPLDAEGVPTWIARIPRKLDWVITGGETDQGAHKARPADPAWFRSLRDQCAAAGVAFHFKQWGEWQPIADPPGNALGRNFSGGFVQRVGKAHDPCMLDGVRHAARPEVWPRG